jgi:mannose-6-phosphate isomerase-like protein (cupin superfamily)
LRRSYEDLSKDADGASPARVLRFFGPEDFETRFQLVERIELEAGARFEIDGPGKLEWFLLALKGDIRLEGPEDGSDIGERSLVLLPHDGTYTLSNESLERVDGLLAAVDTRGAKSGEPTPSALSAQQHEFLDRGRMSPFAAHGGRGEIEFRTMFDQTSTSWASIDHLVLPPDTSVGHHRNHNVEEVFAVLDGRGRMMIEDDVVEIVSGDCISNRLGGAHGAINHTNAPLEILNLSVRSGIGEADVTDLGDDLSSLV